MEETLTSGEAAAIGGIVAGMFTTIMVVGIAITVLLIIAYWKIFTKAGVDGWKSIIPIYNEYILFKIVWDVKNFLISLGLGVGSYVLMMLGGGGLTLDENGNPTFGTAGTIFMVLAGALAIAALVWYVRLQIKTAKAYGKGIGFAMGLLFLPNIFTLILGFGSAQYVGPQTDGVDSQAGSAN